MDQALRVSWRGRTTRCVVRVVFVGLLAASPVTSLHAQAPVARTAPLSEQERAIHLLNRATFGARPQDVDTVLRMGPAAWLERQMDPEALEPLLPRPGAITEPIAFMMPVSNRAPDSARPGAPQMRRITLRTTAGQASSTIVANKLVRAMSSERQLEQVLTDFWVNHFNVSVTKRGVSRGIDSYEDSVRAHVFGRFREMLGAIARHPSMLVYLDNYLNGVPATNAADSAAGLTSINENYARELLELHTLGVDAGYTQRDVIEVARAFTGWSIPLSRPSQQPFTMATVMFTFNQEWHDSGEKVVLGRTLPAGRGIEDGEDVLDILARHPATARHLATKLVRHFVADDPPQEMVDELARVFLESDGDLAKVTRALFTDERFFDPAHYRAKVKRPWDFLLSALRVSSAELGPTGTMTIQSRLAALRHAPFGEAAPTGYPVTADRWVSTGAMMDRMNLALQLSRSSVEYLSTLTLMGQRLTPEPPEVAAVSIDPWEVLTGVRFELRASREVFGGFGAGGTSIQVLALLERMVPGAPTERLRATIMEDLTGHPAGTDQEVLLRRAIALVLGSPEFQRH